MESAHIHMTLARRIYRQFVTAIWLIVAFVTSLLLSWLIVVANDFFYPLAYQTMDIQQTITRFAPENKNRHHFPVNNARLHKQLFSQITQSIQNEGRGLTDINYTGTNNTTYTLLTEAEIIHLEDVAKLVSTLEKAGWTSLVAFLILSVLLLFKLKWRLPGTLRMLLSSILLMVLPVLVAVVVIGPTQLFYALHVKIFPQDHQWFFYYQDSLMTTLMKAPDLFAFIAVEWLLLCLILFTLILWVFQRVSRS